MLYLLEFSYYFCINNYTGVVLFQKRLKKLNNYNILCSNCPLKNLKVFIGCRTFVLPIYPDAADINSKGTVRPNTEKLYSFTNMTGVYESSLKPTVIYYSCWDDYVFYCSNMNEWDVVVLTGFLIIIYWWLRNDRTKAFPTHSHIRFNLGGSEAVVSKLP